MHNFKKEVCQFINTTMDRNIQFITFTITIEKRLFGFIITILGVTGLILAIYNLVRVNAAPNHSVISVAIYGIQGILFFFAGIGLIRKKDFAA